MLRIFFVKAVADVGGCPHPAGLPRPNFPGDVGHSAHRKRARSSAGLDLVLAFDDVRTRWRKWEGNASARWQRRRASHRSEEHYHGRIFLRDERSRQVFDNLLRAIFDVAFNIFADRYD